MPYSRGAEYSEYLMKTTSISQIIYYAGLEITKNIISDTMSDKIKFLLVMSEKARWPNAPLRIFLLVKCIYYNIGRGLARKMSHYPITFLEKLPQLQQIKLKGLIQDTQTINNNNT
ncbi:MAG: hypothetical protein CMB97_01625 [Flavobacteriaceae bacterium]|nr:hypothetical protein [Flavobacteriaceae bacterium]